MKEEIEKQLQDLVAQQQSLLNIAITQFNSKKWNSLLSTVGDIMNAEGQTKMLAAVKNELGRAEKEKQPEAKW